LPVGDRVAQIRGVSFLQALDLLALDFARTEDFDGYAAFLALCAKKP